MSLFVLSKTKVHQFIIQPSLCLIYFNRKLIEEDHKYIIARNFALT